MSIKYKITKWKWLKLFALVCLFLSVILPQLGELGFKIIMLIPFIHLGIIWIDIIFTGLSKSFKGKAYEEEYYIRDNYPELWKKCHPWGDSSYNSLGYISLYKTKTDDPKLIKIIEKSKNNDKWMLSVFLLVPIIWLISGLSFYFNNVYS